jgi:hypothetical protein
VVQWAGDAAGTAIEQVGVDHVVLMSAWPRRCWIVRMS